MIVAIPVLNQFHHAKNAIESFKKNQANDNFYIVMDNGSKPMFSKSKIKVDQINRYPENKGLPYVMNEVLSQARNTDEDWVLFTHSDVLMSEPEWDTKTLDAINQAGNVGLAGYFGAMGLGTADIYQTPYIMAQLARQRPISGNKCLLDSRVHGQTQFTELWHRCAVLDGFSLIVRVDSDIWFWNESIHHMYDQDICLESISKGYQNIVINVAVDHIGGQTDVNEKWTEDKAKVHADSHIPFYEKWRPGNKNITLPYWC